MQKGLVLIGAALVSSSAWMLSANAAAGGADVGLEEVVVTAERRESNVQKTPMNITVVSGQDIQQQGLNNMQEILQGLPGVTVQGQVRGYNPSVRGLGTDLPPGSSQGSVAFQQDGVYDIRAEAGRIGYFDMQRVEVLSGPQGTLYGVNSDGGVVNVISNDPKLGGFEAGIQLQAGNYDLKRGEGMFNAPIGKTAALRVAAASIKRSGYLDTGSSDDDGYAYRAKFLWQPNDRFSGLLGFEGSHLRGKGAGSVNSYINGDASNQFFNGAFVSVPTPWTSATSTFFPGPFSPAGTPCFTDACQTDDYTAKKYWANLKFTAGPVAIQFIPSYKDVADVTNACGMGPCTLSADPKSLIQHSQELRFSNAEKGRLDWAFGAYHWSYQQITPPMGPPAPVDDNIQQKSEGVFADLTVPLAEGWRGRVGARYTRDWKYNNNYVFPAGVSEPVEGKFSHTDYRIGAEWDFRPESMAYVILATGYRPGGFNITNAPPFITPTVDVYKNEEVSDVEIGVKNRFMNGRLQLNADVFYYDFKNAQLLDFYSPAGSFCNFQLGPPPSFPPTFNVKGKNVGLDLSMAMQFTDRDRLNISAEYLDAKYNSSVQIFYNTIDSCAAYNANPNDPLHALDTVTVGSFNLSNTTQPRAPRIAGSIGYEHRFTFSNGGALSVRPSVRYQDATYVHPVQYNVSYQPAYSIFDMGLTYQAPDEKWSLAAWGRNLGEKAVKQSLFPMTLNEPRTYGLTFNMKF